MPIQRTPMLVLATALSLFVAAGPVSANHVQMDSGRVIVFDHAGGNEWWVEAQLAGQDGGQVASLWVAPYPASSSMWTQMTWHADWGKWAASVHVPPGDPVKFRAMWAGGAMQDSCWFSHPDGAESCGGGGNPTPLDATFTLVTGNEWWVQTQVTPNAGHALDHVEVTFGGGDWKPLRLQSWGVREYAASYHIPDGNVVQFRAADTNGLHDLSGCYRWIPPQGGQGQTATEVPCPSHPPALEASWSQVKGNNWWVEGVLTSNEPVYSVFLTIDCSTTTDPADMSYNADWGKWVLGNTYIPSGAKVTFTANGGNSGTQAQSGGYIWPAATPTSGC